MATNDALSLLCNLNILVSLILMVPAAKYCNYGLDINSSESLKNQSCSTRKVSLLSTLFSSDQNSSPTYQDQRDQSNEDEDSNDYAQYENNHQCFIYRFVATQIILPDIKQESVHITFGCDFKNNCEHKVPFREKVNETLGHLFCCDSENCNKVDRLPHLPAENRVCYHGTGNRLDAETNMKESCVHPDVMCAKLSVHSSEGLAENYFCDNHMLCRNQMTSGAFRSCHASVVENTTQELCCCDASMCFEPQWLNPQPDSGLKSTNYSEPPFVDAEKIEKPDATKDGLVITGLVAALVFVTAVGGVIIIVMACNKRRRPRPDPNVIMQYERLSATDQDVVGAFVL